MWLIFVIEFIMSDPGSGVKGGLGAALALSLLAVIVLLIVTVVLLCLRCYGNDN